MGAMLKRNVDAIFFAVFVQTGIDMVVRDLEGVSFVFRTLLQQGLMGVDEG